MRPQSTRRPVSFRSEAIFHPILKEAELPNRGPKRAVQAPRPSNLLLSRAVKTPANRGKRGEPLSKTRESLKTRGIRSRWFPPGPHTRELNDPLVGFCEAWPHLRFCASTRWKRCLFAAIAEKSRQQMLKNALLWRFRTVLPSVNALSNRKSAPSSPECPGRPQG